MAEGNQALLENGFKMEVESLISKDISYVTEQYTPARLKAEDWLVSHGQEQRVPSREIGVGREAETGIPDRSEDAYLCPGGVTMRKTQGSNSAASDTCTSDISARIQNALLLWKSGQILMCACAIYQLRDQGGPKPT